MLFVQSSFDRLFKPISTRESSFIFLQFCNSRESICTVLSFKRDKAEINMSFCEESSIYRHPKENLFKFLSKEFKHWSILCISWVFIDSVCLNSNPKFSTFPNLEAIWGTQSSNWFILLNWRHSIAYLKCFTFGKHSFGSKFRSIFLTRQSAPDWWIILRSNFLSLINLFNAETFNALVELSINSSIGKWIFNFLRFPKHSSLQSFRIGNFLVLGYEQHPLLKVILNSSSFGLIYKVFWSDSVHNFSWKPSQNFSGQPVRIL